MHEQRIKLKPCSRFFLTWAFYFVNDGSNVNVKVP